MQLESSEHEREHDQTFLKQMGITADKVVYPEHDSRDDELTEFQRRFSNSEKLK